MKNRHDSIVAIANTPEPKNRADHLATHLPEQPQRENSSLPK